MKEIWKDVEGYKGIYQISNLGRLKSLPIALRTIHGSITHRPEYISVGSKNGDGYILFKLTIGKKTSTIKCHRLIFHHFKHPINSSQQIDHIDRDRANNSLDNLRVCKDNYVNARNRTDKEDGKTTSKYTNVSRAKLLWRTQITINNHTYNLGTYKTEKKAHEVFLYCDADHSRINEFIFKKTSKYKGVWIDKEYGVWRAQYRDCKKKRWYLGTFNTEKEAGIAVLDCSLDESKIYHYRSKVSPSNSGPKM